MIFVVDNYDSFTYNLVQLLGVLKQDVVVRRNDETTIDEIRGLNPDGILISPGPGRPENAGVSVDVVKKLGSSIPVFGVCLGHQAIGLAFGGSIVHAPTLMHGKTSEVRHDGSELFSGVENPFTATRYHSLVVSPDGLPDELAVTATTENGVIMGLQHKSLRITGVQFHPESILKEAGKQILHNWIGMQKRP